MIKKIITFILIICASAAYAANNLMMTHVGSAGGSGVAPSCTGTIDLSKGCALPMLGGAP